MLPSSVSVSLLCGKGETVDICLFRLEPGRAVKSIGCNARGFRREHKRTALLACTAYCVFHQTTAITAATESIIHNNILYPQFAPGGCKITAKGEHTSNLAIALQKEEPRCRRAHNGLQLLFGKDHRRGGQLGKQAVYGLHITGCSLGEFKYAFFHSSFN